ncbi:FYVE zinc finger domain containing protein [Nitzschia inconspicua]|uniref:FYVE zinc finger domain containing protein n=1 Tax=Nitzschia inconspicua TaxID=303405 RepID=A0A9K3KM92_9STRA|nr:FYVE zinc finger domain containing protein [Nitzschia inconspicua]
MATQSFPTGGSLESSILSQGDATIASSACTADGIGDFVPPPSSWFEQHDSLVEGSHPQLKQSNDTRRQRNVRTAITIRNDCTELVEKGPPTPTQHEESDYNASIPGQRIPLQTYFFNDEPLVATAVIGNPRPSPSWKEISSQVLPAAARELLSSSLRRIYDTARLSYSRGRWHRKYSDIGNVCGGTFARTSKDLALPVHLSELPPFSSLPWIDRQLVLEWRTYLPENSRNARTLHQNVEDAEEEHAQDLDDFEIARTLVPNILPRPSWQKSDVCFECHQNFGPTRLRHHCRSCGRSFCHAHSSSTQRLPHLGYEDIAERVCDRCNQVLEEQNLAERVAWRLARCRDYSTKNLTPYFETGLDSVEEVAIRVTKAAIAMAKKIPLGAQATVAVETVDVLRKYGLHGIYGIMLRKEFLAAADLLRRALGINKTSWPLSVHELSAAIFYALAQHRAMRGLHPERENTIHRFRPQNSQSLPDGIPNIPIWTEPSGERTASVDRLPNAVPRVVDSYELSALDFHSTPVIDQTDTYNPDFSCTLKTETDDNDATVFMGSRHPHSFAEKITSTPKHATFSPVCDPVPDTMIASLVFYAPIALNFIYAEKEVEIQLLAAQQGWRLLYAFMTQDLENIQPSDRPASAFFAHQEQKIICLSIRGTATINDVITDIRQTPVPFPDMDPDSKYDNSEGDWTNVFNGQGLALCGMAAAAVNLFREHIDSILYFAKQGYRIRLVGHSLGGGVATLMGILVLKHLERFRELNHRELTREETAILKVYAYGTPSCLDAKLAASVNSFVTTVVLHDDVFPRLTPTSCRGLLKHLLHIRETWVKTHIEEDLRAVGERAKTAWAPRFRQNFALHSTSTSSIKKYCKKQIQKGRCTLKCVKDKAIGRPPADRMTRNLKDVLVDNLDLSADTAVEIDSSSSSPSTWGENFFVPASELSIKESFHSSKDGIVASEGEFSDRTQLLVEVLGGGDTETEGLVIDGDEFFEPEESLLEGSDDESKCSGKESFRDPIPGQSPELSVHTNDSWSYDMQGGEESLSEQSASLFTIDANGAAAVVIEEAPLPRMFVPGRVVHIYSHRGVYKAAYVPRTFRELRRISLAGNMLSNHTAKSYFEGLLEVQTARIAVEAPPRWTAFDEDDTCSCCANRFTWASTSNSEAQEARDKHNCRSCGGLVCDPCSKNRVPIPSIGLTVPVRTCDRCYNDIMGGVSAASSVMTSSYMGPEEGSATSSDSTPSRSAQSDGYVDEYDRRPERTRERRSVIVDDLVSQMRSSALTQH